MDVRLDGVSKRYPTPRGEEPITALRDVTIDVADGELFTLVGPSGCGKTTTLRLIAGFDSSSAGTIRFGDREMAGVPPEKRDVGLVFQEYALFPHMSVRENVGYGLRYRDPPAGSSVDGRIEELLSLVDLEGMGGRMPDALSGGQQQRVALARALAPDPQLLLLDEPMSALDARLRTSLRRQLRRIQRALDVTTVYVTHDQEEALAISDRIGVMNAGRIEQTGTPEAIYRRPATRFVATFVGENNLFEGRVTSIEEDGGARRVVVSVDDTPFTIRTEATVEARDRIAFCVRPEDVASAPESAENRFEVRIEQSEFRGSSALVRGRWNRRSIAVELPDVPRASVLPCGFPPDAARVVETGIDG